MGPLLSLYVITFTFFRPFASFISFFLISYQNTMSSRVYMCVCTECTWLVQELSLCLAESIFPLLFDIKNKQTTKK